jgi:hypothetical protein
VQVIDKHLAEIPLGTGSRPPAAPGTTRTPGRGRPV